MTRRSEEALRRAGAAVSKPARYVLGAGGRKPTAPECFTTRDGKLGSDCVGFVMWALLLDRLQPAFRFYDGWMNTDSVIKDARTPGYPKFWEEVAVPEVGCLVIFPSIYKNGKMVRMGHVGLVVEVPKDFPRDWAHWPSGDKKRLLKTVKVIDCNASPWRKLRGKAIGMATMADMWNKPDTVLVRFIEPCHRARSRRGV